MCANRIEMLDAFLGCGWSGAILVPINTAARGAQLRHMLENSGAKLLLVDAELLSVIDELSVPDSLERVWVHGEPAAPSHERSYVVEPAFPAAAPAEPAQLGPDDTLGILYTSGTTGVSKGVCCPHGQFFWWGILAGEQLQISQDDHLFTCLPLFHTNALNAFMQALLAGASYTVASRFSATRFWQQASESGATVTYLLGAMVGMLCNQPPRDHDTSHRVRIALAPAVPSQFQEEFERRFGPLIVEGYGSTELNFVIGSPPQEQRPGWMGRLLPEFDVVVADEHDAPVPTGTPGELLVRPREPFSTATGYFGMPDKTLEAWRNLWFHTGDRVLRDEDGWFRFVDRAKDAIRRRGENISSFEVEEALMTHPAVREAAVFPVPSELGEDEVMAAVIPAAGSTVEPVELVEHCIPRLAYFAIPRFIDVVSSLPLTDNGKIRKVVLRERGVTTETFDREAAGIDVRWRGTS